MLDLLRKLQSEGINMLYLFTDGCSGQFRSRYHSFCSLLSLLSFRFFFYYFRYTMFLLAALATKFGFTVLLSMLLAHGHSIADSQASVVKRAVIR